MDLEVPSRALQRPAMKRPAMKGPSKGEVGAPAKKLRTLPPLNRAADPQNHVFFSLADYDNKLDELFEGGHDVVFIRGGIATGKTTLAEHLARQFPDKYVMVPFTGAGRASVWMIRTTGAIEKATDRKTDRDCSAADGKIDRDSLVVAFAESLKLAKERELTLVYDEAHTLFASSDLCSTLFKSDEKHRPKLLLFSASGVAFRSENLTASTPTEITQKFMWIAALTP